VRSADVKNVIRSSGKGASADTWPLSLAVAAALRREGRTDGCESRPSVRTCWGHQSARRASKRRPRTARSSGGSADRRTGAQLMSIGS